MPQREKAISARHGSARLSDKERALRIDAVKKLGGKDAHVVFGFYECKIGSEELSARGEVLVVPLNYPNRNAKAPAEKTGFRGQYVNPTHLRASKRN